jgi:predicted phage-related endonuclease
MEIERHQPKDRAEWRALRRQDINASRIGGLLPGVHPYVTAYQLFAEHTGRIVPDDHIDTPTTRRGLVTETIGAQFTAEQLPGAQITVNGLEYWRDPHRRIGATPDLRVIDSTRGLGVVELKCIEPGVYARTWRDHEPPTWIRLQALTQARLTGATWAAIGALRIGYGVEFDLIPVPLNDGEWSALLADVAVFWRMVELNQPPAPDFGRDAATIAALNATVDGSSIDLSDDPELCAAVAERERFKRATKEFDTRCNELEGLIRHKAGTHSIILAGDYRVTIKEEHRGGYTVAPGVRHPLRVKRIRNIETA